MTSKLLTTKDTAVLLGVSAAFLERDRWTGPTIPFVRVGARAVRYRESDVAAFLEERLTVPRGVVEHRR